MKHACLILGFVAGIVLGSRPSTAQYTVDFQTNIISGVASNWAGACIVGSNTFADMLLIQSGGALTNVPANLFADSYVGYEVGGSNNSVLVTDPGSIWNLGTNSYGENNSLTVGYSGAGNSLVISNGGRVIDDSGFIGYNTNSSGNSALVTGTGSIWSNAYALYVGGNGASNRLMISNGGFVRNDSSYGGGWVGISSSSSNNSVLITDPGSVWSNASFLAIGLQGAGNSLVVSNGGQMVNGADIEVGNSGVSNSLIVAGGTLLTSNMFVGFNSSASNNSVQVSGQVVNSTYIYVGYSGGSNNLTMAGGTLLTSNMVVGYSASASNNSVAVSGGSLIITNAPGKGSLVVGQSGQGRLILNGGTTTVDNLILTNGTNSQIEFDAGQLNSRSTAVTNAAVFAVGDGTAEATFDLLGGSHSFADGLWIHTNANLAGCGVVIGKILVEGALRADCGGQSVFTGSVTNYGLIEADNGTVLVFDGPLVNFGQIVATNGEVDYYSAFENHGTLLGDVQNELNVWISSSGGRWESAANWSLGAPTNEFWCAISNNVSKTVVIDAVTASAHPETLTIDGLTLGAPDGVTNVLLLSGSGTGMPLRIQTELIVGTGGKLAINQGAVQAGAFNGESLTIDGEVAISAGALIATNGPTWVSDVGHGQMTASNGVVLTRETLVGYSTGMSGALTVVGSNSVWNCSSNLWIGWYGAGNNLAISNGGQLVNNSGYLGNYSSSSNNSVLVTDTGSVWSNVNSLYVGYSGRANSLVISNGGQVANGYGSVGASSGSSNNIVQVIGPGSLWNNSGSLSIGTSGNGLVVTNGGVVVNGYGYLGYSIIGTNDSVLVTGSGSVWSNRNDLYVGDFGRDNSLVISNGGRVFNGYGYVGGSTSSTSTNNSVVVSGTGSVWSNWSGLTVGYFGVSNSLVVNNGGQVAAVGTLTVGYSGTGNSTVISNGGQVLSSAGCLSGPYYYSSNNSVVVTDPGSIWSNASDLCVGGSGGGNSLTISSGGRVYCAGASIGSNTTANGNSVTAKGTGSAWSLGWDLYVGGGGAANSLAISDGAVVSFHRFFVGYGSSSSNNSVLVAGPGSAWNSINAQSYWGYSGPGNSLVISNGGKVSTDTCAMGYNSSSGNNRVLVTGSGSVWSNLEVRYVGYSGAGNSLVISNGGEVVDNFPLSQATRGCFLGYNFNSSNNSVLVTDPGSVWSVNTNLYVGYVSCGNKLVISNDAQVIDSDAYVGWGPPYPPYSNQVCVADGGLWQNNSMYIGYYGRSNSLVVAGGSVLASGLTIGFSSQYAPATCDNWVELDSGSIVVTNATHDAVFEVRNGKLILNGGTLQVDQFVMTNACAQFVRTGGTLIYSTAVLDPNASAVGDGIPNWWKQQYGLDPLDPSVANADPDGDGMSNLEEYEAGTDPTNSASAFRIIDIEQDDDDILLTWTAVGGKAYVLQTAADVTGSLSNDFVDLNPAIVAPGTGETTVSVVYLGGATNAPAQFYRVRLVP